MRVIRVKYDPFESRLQVGEPAGGQEPPRAPGRESALLPFLAGPISWACCASSVLSALRKEYASSEGLEIHFIGTDADFALLQQEGPAHVLQEGPAPVPLTLVHTGILPEPQEELERLRREYAQVRAEFAGYLRGGAHYGEAPEITAALTRFADAVSEDIPVCVMGPSAAHRAALINALVGWELLPVDSAPCAEREVRVRLCAEDCYELTLDYGAERAEATRMTFVLREGRIASFRTAGGRSGAQVPRIARELERLGGAPAPDSAALLRALVRQLMSQEGAAAGERRKGQKEQKEQKNRRSERQKENLLFDIGPVITVTVPCRERRLAQAGVVLCDVPDSFSFEGIGTLAGEKKELSSLAGGFPVLVLGEGELSGLSDPARSSSLGSAELGAYCRQIDAAEDLAGAKTLVVILPEGSENGSERGLHRGVDGTLTESVNGRARAIGSDRQGDSPGAEPLPDSLLHWHGCTQVLSGPSPQELRRQVQEVILTRGIRAVTCRRCVCGRRELLLALEQVSGRLQVQHRDIARRERQAREQRYCSRRELEERLRQVPPGDLRREEEQLSARYQPVIAEYIADLREKRAPQYYRQARASGRAMERTYNALERADVREHLICACFEGEGGIREQIRSLFAAYARDYAERLRACVTGRPGELSAKERAALQALFAEDISPAPPGEPGVLSGLGQALAALQFVTGDFKRRLDLGAEAYYVDRRCRVLQERLCDSRGLFGRRRAGVFRESVIRGPLADAQEQLQRWQEEYLQHVLALLDEESAVLSGQGREIADLQRQAEDLSLRLECLQGVRQELETPPGEGEMQAEQTERYGSTRGD